MKIQSFCVYTSLHSLVSTVVVIKTEGQTKWDILIIAFDYSSSRKINYMLFLKSVFESWGSDNIQKGSR